jgi:hypothetical protein
VSSIQTIGYLVIAAEKLLVLVRRSKYGVALKIRGSGSDGMHMTDAELYLNQHPEKVLSLKRGTVLHL